MAISPMALKDVFISGEDFRLNQLSPEVVQLSFGPVSVGLSLDAAYELQYRLAAFLAEIELESDYPEVEYAGGCGCEPLEKSRSALEAFVTGSTRNRKLDS